MAKRSRAKKCRFGKLKHPKGRRVCRKRPLRRKARGHSRRRVKRSSSSRRRVKRGSVRSQESAMWRLYRAGKL